MNKDAQLIFENYSKIHEAQAPQSNPVGGTVKRLKDLNAFNTNLNAIDAFEDKTSALIDTAVKTGFFNQQEADQAKKVLGGSIIAFLQSLVLVTDAKTAQDIEQMKKAITDKIKSIDTNMVVNTLNSVAASLKPQAPAQAPAAAQTTPQAPAVPPAQTPTVGS